MKFIDWHQKRINENENLKHPGQDLLQPEYSDIRFLQTILDNAADPSPPLVFADWLEERGRTEIAVYLRMKIQKQKIPEELIPLDNFFFRSATSSEVKDTPLSYMGNTWQDFWRQSSLSEKEAKFWTKALTSKYYSIYNNTFGSDRRYGLTNHNSRTLCYSVSKKVFFWVQAIEFRPWWRFHLVKDLPLELWWEMAVHAMKLEKLIK